MKKQNKKAQQQDKIEIIKLATELVKLATAAIILISALITLR